jgi:hypothetical protein
MEIENENSQPGGDDLQYYQETLFNRQDVEEAIQQTNFNKGLGPDSFDGSILQDEAVK